MILPKEFTHREALNSLTGIKSSLANLRRVVALTYLLYLSSGKKSSVVYAESKGDSLVLKQEHKNFIKNFFGNDEIIETIDDNPLLTSQIESLYVGLTLMFGLGRMSFEDSALSMTKERTGGIRYPKKIDFASNIITLDLLLSGYSSASAKETLLAWLRDNQLMNEIDQNICVFLNISIENNLFKLRQGDANLYFQTEGIYKSLLSGEDVTLESDEVVGPTRILNSMLREGLMPWLSFRKSLVSKSNSNEFDISSYSEIISTSLNIRDIKIDNSIVNIRQENDVVIKRIEDVKNSPYYSYLTAIRTKPFLLLAGISGTGKSRIVRKLAQATNDIDFVADYDGDDRWKKHNPTNFCLIQVKPNWHNSMDVVGFKSNIGGAHYEFTPFIEFIAKAWHYPDTPFFLCLDEMNLAPVEEYFAEFLSAIESRSYNKGGEYETDPIVNPFDSFGPEVCGQMIAHLVDQNLDTDRKLENQFRTKGLTLPKNLIVMGTVNMDETTFSFSRKVLDRAMSIEMNEVDYDAFLTGETEEDVPLLTDCNKLLVERPINAQVVKNEIEADKIIDYLKQMNELLEGTPFKLGYRAANEAFLYVSASKMFGSDDLGSALDKFSMMKILSRIEGDDSKLKTKSGEELLPALLELLINQFGEDSKSISIQKLTEMNDILVRDHFVSFWG